ncbi:MAG: hypothetical protein ACRDVM_08275 [Acidimicrobiia bacterium]
MADEWVGQKNPWIVIYSPDETLTTHFEGVLAKHDVSGADHGDIVSIVAHDAPRHHKGLAATAVARTDWGR